MWGDRRPQAVFIGCALRACLVGLSTSLPASARSSFRARKSDFARLSCASLDSTLQSRPARSHPRGARTRGVELPQRTFYASHPWRRITTEDILRLASPFSIQINVKVKKMANFFATAFANSEKRCYVINEAGKQEFPETKK